MTCQQCKGTGLLPFKNKEGKVIPHTFLFCSCKEENQHDHLPALKPEDFDFPVSYSVYRSLCQLHGWHDPGPDRPEEQTIIELVKEPGNKDVTDSLHRTQVLIGDLKNRLNQHIDVSKKVSKPTKYQGLKIEKPTEDN